MSTTALVRARKALAEERKWYDSHGGSLSAYIARYGSKNDAEHFGDGGEAIHAADLAALERAEQRWAAAERKANR